MKRWKKWLSRMCDAVTPLVAFGIGRDGTLHGWHWFNIALAALFGIAVVVDVLYAFVGLFDAEAIAEVVNEPAKDQ